MMATVAQATLRYHSSGRKEGPGPRLKSTRSQYDEAILGFFFASLDVTEDLRALHATRMIRYYSVIDDCHCNP